MSRHYNLSLGELIDRLAIVTLKEAKIPEHKAEYAKEADQLVHDINLEIQEKKTAITGEWIRDIIINAQFNGHIWENEGDIRGQINDSNLSEEQLAKIGKRLILTHSLNGIRSTAKNRISQIVSGRQDYKVDCLAAAAEMWRPSGY